MPIEIRAPQAPLEFELYYDLRWRLLRRPWAQSIESARDHHEDGAMHLGLWLDGRLAGVGRVHLNSPEEAQIRFMAVEEDCQGRGLGGLLLRELEKRAVAAGARRIVLNARDRAVRFYEKHGYHVAGPSAPLFESIGHWQMLKAVTSGAPPATGESPP